MSQRAPISRRKEMLDLLVALHFTRIVQIPHPDRFVAQKQYLHKQDIL
jgi:hypothetical protein